MPTTILIIDDEPDLLQLISDTLELLGHYHVVTATNGIEGLRQWYAQRPDCVIVDVMMPEMDGFRFTQLLRGDPETAQTPLILLTALAQDRNRFIGLALGADQYLIKPVTPQDLLMAVQRALQAKESARIAQLRALADGPVVP